jgi:pantoate--beta-alanine ligase
MVGNAGGVRVIVRKWRSAGETVAFVPTMGNLHDGHMDLIERAAREADRVAVSIFVNPTQFAPGEDYARYPRTLDADRTRLAEARAPVDLLFVPEEQEIYPFGSGAAVRVVVPGLSEDLCGASRPGHFDGVASVVCRFLHIMTPDVLLLGQKDYQQLLVVRRMVADLQMPVSVVSVPIRREPDGLASSSRNQYLTAAERRIAPQLHAALERVLRALQAGDSDYARLESEAKAELERAGFRPDYVAVRRAADLARPAGEAAGELMVLGAAWLGATRLIDNLGKE